MSRYTRLMIVLIAVMVAIPCMLGILATAAKHKYDWEMGGKDQCIAQGRKDCF